jgi:hypothetical protein
MPAHLPYGPVLAFTPDYPNFVQGQRYASRILFARGLLGVNGFYVRDVVVLTTDHSSRFFSEGAHIFATSGSGNGPAWVCTLGNLGFPAHFKETHRLAVKGLLEGKWDPSALRKGSYS